MKQINTFINDFLFFEIYSEYKYETVNPTQIAFNQMVQIFHQVRIEIKKQLTNLQ